MRIFGIDPGTRFVGFGVVEATARPRLVDAGTIAAKVRDARPERLRQLRDALRARLEAAAPDVIAIEKAFHGRNVAALIAMAEGRGVALVLAADLGVPIFEYAPAEVKKAVTGRGGARKDQVALMVRSILGTPRDLAYGTDATDALAVALCHAQRWHVLQGDGGLAAIAGGAAGGRSAVAGGRTRRGRGR